MDTYALTIRDIRQKEHIEISADRFNELVNAEMIVRVAAQVEEKMDLLLENYINYEKEILSLSLSNMIRNSFADDHVERARPNLNRLLVNILTAAKLYVDQTCAELSSGFGKSSELYKKWNNYRRQQHEDSPSYQLMEIMRNYVQHRSLPINTAGFRQGFDRNENPDQYRRTVIVKSDVYSLLEFDGFKKNIKLIESLENRVNSKRDITLGYHICEYIDCLCRVHMEFRRLSQNYIRSGEASIESAREEAALKFGEKKLIGLIAVHIDTNQSPMSECRLNGRRMERRRSLSKVNMCDGNLSTSYVHSMSLENDQ